VSHRRSASQVVIRQPTGLPDRLYVKLIYREAVAFSQAGGAVGDNVYRGNSLFDPDLTGTGGQPSGFDQWAAFYATYTVLGSKCEVISMSGGGSACNTIHGITPTNFSSVFTDVERAQEQPYDKSDTIVFGSQGIGQGKLSNYMSTSKIIGVVRPAIQIEDSYSALVSANPAVQWFWHVWNLVPTANTQALQQQVKLTYFCVFETRQFLATS
jgi:hypothetical protein